METWTAFHLASDEEFHAAFRGWKHSPPLLPTPVARHMSDPQNDEPVTIVSRVSDFIPRPDPGATRQPDVSRLPMLPLKNIGKIEIGQLGRALLGWSARDATDEVTGRVVYGPLIDSLMFEIAPALVQRLAGLTPEELPEYANAWIGVRQAEASPFGTPEPSRAPWLETLGKLAAFSVEAVAGGRRMYAWVKG
jgi:hypothetical protein